MLLGVCGSAAGQCSSALLRYPQESQSTLVCPPGVIQASDFFQSPAKTHQCRHSWQDIQLKLTGSLFDMHNTLCHRNLCFHNIRWNWGCGIIIPSKQPPLCKITIQFKKKLLTMKFCSLMPISFQPPSVSPPGLPPSPPSSLPVFVVARLLAAAPVVMWGPLLNLWLSY